MGRRWASELAGQGRAGLCCARVPEGGKRRPWGRGCWGPSEGTGCGRLGGPGREGGPGGAASLWRTAERGWVGGAKGRPASRRSPVGAPAPLLLRVGGVGGGPGLALGFGLPREGGAEGPAAARPCVAKAVRLQAGPGRFLLANNPCVDGPVFV